MEPGHLQNMLIWPLTPFPHLAITYCHFQLLLSCPLLWEALLTSPVMGFSGFGHRLSEAG